MIYVLRTQAPAIFTKDKSPAQLERAEAEAIFSQNPPTEKFEAKFYTRHKNKYKDELIAMFNSRCAYCECCITVGNRGDVEHFRPKSEYTTENLTEGTPGYYWLAADWSNLYLSCTNCNQVTTFDILDAKDITKKVRKPAGKSTQFGLSDEKYRRNYHTMNCEEEEPYRLLVDPCKDRPETLFEFLEQGVIKPKSQDEFNIKKANYSIGVYVLQREVLVKARKERWLLVKNRLQDLDDNIDAVFENFKQGQNLQRAMRYRNQLKRNFKELFSLLDVKRVPNEFIALTRQIVHPFLSDYSDKIRDFLSPVHKDEKWWQPAVDYFKPQVLALKNYMDQMTN